MCLLRLGDKLLTRLQLKKDHGDGALTSYVKGAPERVLEKCSTYLLNGVMHPITDEFKRGYDDAYNVRPPARLSCHVWSLLA